MTIPTSEQPLPIRAYGLFSNLQSAVLLVFRFTWGLSCYLSGWRHLHNIDATVDFFKELHVPFPTFSVYVSGTTELLGGLLLMLGLATRLISIPLVFNFIVAIVSTSSDALKQFAFGGDHFKRYNAGHIGGLEKVMDDTAFPFLMLSLVTLAFGPGRISLDYLIQRTLLRRYTTRPDDPSVRGFQPLEVPPDVQVRRQA